jgi:hypothetical protein
MSSLIASLLLQGRPHRLSRRQTANDILEFDRPYKSNRGARVRALGRLGAVGIQLGIDAINAG